MNGLKRREMIIKRITDCEKPLSASALAKEMQVSRQIIVGDIALLRAAGHDIYATPRGYVIRMKESACHFTIACVHNHEDTRDELYIVVDHGATVLDVIVEHPVYGQLCGQLDLHARIDVDNFIERTMNHDIKLLSSLTDGIHLHTIECRDEKVKDQILNALKKKGYLLQNQD